MSVDFICGFFMLVLSVGFLCWFYLLVLSVSPALPLSRSPVDTPTIWRVRENSRLWAFPFCIIIGMMVVIMKIVIVIVVVVAVNIILIIISYY